MWFYIIVLYDFLSNNDYTASPNFLRRTKLVQLLRPSHLPPHNSGIHFASPSLHSAASSHLIPFNLQVRTTRGNMSGDEAPTPVVAEAPAPALGEPMDIMTAVQLVLRKSLAHGGLVRGLHEAAKVVEKHAAQLCVLAEDCDQQDYVKLVKGLCAEHNVNMLTVPNAKTLGEWAGLCKIDSEGKARKVVGCSCVVVKDFGEDHEALHVVQQHVKA
ncbi:hypothetical protein ACLB2K_063125 [Fragaria x ananassa]